MASNVPQSSNSPEKKNEKKTLVYKDRKPTLDPVKEDGVLKELVKNQEKSLENWEKRWSFMRQTRTLWEEEAVKRGFTKELFVKKINEPWKELTKPTIPLPECTKTPVTSSGMIGWRSDLHLNNIAGPMFISPVQTIDPPRRDGDLERGVQTYIFLG